MNGRRIIIVGEGQTEQSFCNDVLQPHFNHLNVLIQNPTIKKTGGGIVNWAALKAQIQRHLAEDQTAYVTTLIDYYGIYQHHKYPFWREAHAMADKSAAITIMEDGMLAEIDNRYRGRFIPYIQLHEFEAILFSDITVFDNSFDKDEFLDYQYLVNTISAHPNPELINDGIETAPSKRLAKIIKGYFSDQQNHKDFYGATLAHDIGLTKIREKCPRFHQWITKLETITWSLNPINNK